MSEIKTDRKFENALYQVIKNEDLVYAWYSLNNVLYKCNLKMKTFRKNAYELEFEVGEKEEEALRNVIGGSKIINIHIPSESIAFNAEVKNIEGHRIKVSLPTKYSFYNRRVDERYELERTVYLKMFVGNNIFKKSVFDVSVGGFSVVLSMSDRVRLEKGMQFGEMVIEVGAAKIYLSAEIVNTLIVDRFKLSNYLYGGIKISFKINGFKTSKDEKAYQHFISQEEFSNRLEKRIKKA